MMADVVFLLDCDNTLLDNDHVERDIGDQLVRELGPAVRDQYWDAVRRLRTARGYTDYLGALQCVRTNDLSDAGLLPMSSFLLDYPLATRRYPAALDAIRHPSQWGTPVILSDGDVEFQPRKIRCSGLWDAVDGGVLISIHKEQILGVLAATHTRSRREGDAAALRSWPEPLTRYPIPPRNHSGAALAGPEDGLTTARNSVYNCCSIASDSGLLRESIVIVGSRRASSARNSVGASAPAHATSRCSPEKNSLARCRASS